MRAQEYLKVRLQEAASALGLSWPDKVVIEPPKDKKFGDLACNAAMIMAREAKRQPRGIAEELAAYINKDDMISSVDVAGAGFINVRFAVGFWQSLLLNVLEQKDKFGACANTDKAGTGRRKAQIEFVSANPTGPLHIGHARGAAVGDSLARLLRFRGYEASSEYYINDAGRQMRTLGNSVWLRLLELSGKTVELPEELYKGDYIIDIARELLKAQPDMPSLSDDEGREACFDYAHKKILEWIKTDLSSFGVHIDTWSSERALLKTGAVEKTLEKLDQAGQIFTEEGALWFKSSNYGDDKDRVLRKSNGDLTYFTTDIAYHQDKFNRGFDLLVDIWGADHHGYIPRMKAAIEAIGHDPASFEVIIIQMVNWLSGGVQMAMSTRAGQFETLADVLGEVGSDAARFMFLSRKSDSPLDFDLDLVKSQSMENPVYYVQYAHARICTLFAKALERKLVHAKAADFIPTDPSTLSSLTAEEDLELMRMLDVFPGMLETSAQSLAPHHISYYLMELASMLHRYYASTPILNETDAQLLQARLALLAAVAHVFRNGLDLLGVSAPESM